MDAMNMHQFQNSGTSSGALARPPGLEAPPASIRKVSFAADREASPKDPEHQRLAGGGFSASQQEGKASGPRLAGGGFAASQQELQLQPRIQSTSGAVIDIKFCVHCGTKVADKLLKMKNVKFCVHCGKQHPENFMDAASKSVKAETPNEEFADLISLKKKVETLKTVDMLAQLISICDAQLMPATSQGQIGQQQVPWNGKVLGEQCRQSAGLWGQHGALQQHAGYAGYAGSAYAHAGHSA